MQKRVKKGRKRKNPMTPKRSKRSKISSQLLHFQVLTFQDILMIVSTACTTSECGISGVVHQFGQVTFGLFSDFFKRKNTEKLRYRISIIFDVHVRHLVRRIGYITDPYHVTCPRSLD